MDANRIPLADIVASLTAERDEYRRRAEALDLLVAEKERMLVDKESDYRGVVLEFDDLNDELTRTKQDLELARLELQAERGGSSDGSFFDSHPLET